MIPVFKPGVLWPACAWFFEIAFVHEVNMCVCPHPQGYKLHSDDIEPVYQDDVSLLHFEM